MALRDYQQEASDAAVKFFRNKRDKSNALIIAPTGSGKTHVIADIASKLNTNVLVLCPNKDILEQDHSKMKLYGYDGGIYSASAGKKIIKRITFAMIGSIMAHIDDFDEFGAIIIDEAHCVNAAGGMYKTFLTKVPRKILGLTATPYRLFTQLGIEYKGEFFANGSYKEEDYFIGGFMPKPGVVQTQKCILKFLTRTRPRIFSKVIYDISIQKLLKDGYLAHLQYFSMLSYDKSRVKLNSTGRDYDEQSLQSEYERSNVDEKLIDILMRLLHPKRGGERKGILVFTSFIWQAEKVAKQVPNSVVVSANTPKKERERITKAFKAGQIKFIINVGIFTTGFDYPALDTVVMARPTKSLALYYQCIGRAIRPYKGKHGWIIDLTDNYEKFGRVEDLYMSESRPGQYVINGYAGGQWKPLTNVYY